jgi:hypothetical protein
MVLFIDVMISAHLPNLEESYSRLTACVLLSCGSVYARASESYRPTPPPNHPRMCGPILTKPATCDVASDPLSTGQFINLSTKQRSCIFIPLIVARQRLGLLQISLIQASYTSSLEL